MSISSVLPIGLDIRTNVLPQEHFSCVIVPISLVLKRISRECFFCQAGENYLALRAVGNVFSRFGVYYFNYKIVFVDVHSVLFGAFIRNAGAADLGKAVYVVCFLCRDVFLSPHAFPPSTVRLRKYPL